MNLDLQDKACDHDWIAYDDPAAYIDGFNCPTVAICSRCHSRKDIAYKDDGIEWHKILLLPIYLVLLIIVAVFIETTIIAKLIFDFFTRKRD